MFSNITKRFCYFFPFLCNKQSCKLICELSESINVKGTNAQKSTISSILHEIFLYMSFYLSFQGIFILSGQLPCERGLMDRVCRNITVHRLVVALSWPVQFANSYSISFKTTNTRKNEKYWLAQRKSAHKTCTDILHIEGHALNFSTNIHIFDPLLNSNIHQN